MPLRQVLPHASKALPELSRNITQESPSCSDSIQVLLRLLTLTPPVLSPGFGP
jgi:hypothetical protein